MKHLLPIILALSFVVAICGCEKRSSDNVTTEAIDYCSPYKYIDTLVSLSFLGISLGDNVDAASNKLKVEYTTTVTDDVAKRYKGKKALVLNGVSTPIEMEYYTVNDTVCEIIGTLKNDKISKDLFETYSAKYQKPTIGELLEEYKPYTNGNSISWDFKNQAVSLLRRVDKKWNLNTRPFSEYYEYQNTTIKYSDYRLKKRYDHVLNEQWEYDREMRPILDSIRASEEKRVKDSIYEIERTKRLKDAHQI